MSKKHRITKRLLAFALSVAMIVTFTPTAMLSYAGEDAAKAAVEEPANEATPAKDDVVKEEPAKEEATESKDDVVKEKEEAEEATPGEEATKEIPVHADIEILKDPVHKTYNGQEQSVSYTASELKSFYKVVYWVDGKEASSLPEGFNVEVYALKLEVKEDVDISNGVTFKGTDVGEYGVNMRVRITGSAPGYNIEATKYKVNPIKMVIDPLAVNVTVTGVTKEMTYDGVSHPLDLRFATISCDNELYDTGAVIEEIKPNSARNAGTYTTGTIAGLVNLDKNFTVSFTTVPGELTITPAPATVYTASDRHIVVPESDKYFECPKGYVEGLVGSDAKEWVEVVPDGQLPLWETGETDNTVGEINWNGVNKDNYELEYDLGTLTVFAEDEVQIIIRGNSNDKKIVYDGNVHSIDGYSIGWIDNPVFDKEVYDKYRENLDELFEFTGTAHVEAADAGHHPMGLTADQFSINPDNEEAQGYKVTFVVEDGYLDIDKKSLTVNILTRHEIHDYTGEEISMRAFDWSIKESSGGAVKKGTSEAKGTSDAEYKEEYIALDGGNVIKGTDIGVYEKTLKVGDFHNTNDNFDVTFKIAGAAIIKEDAAKAAVQDNIASKTYTSTLEIVRPVVRVQLDGSQFETGYDGKEHTLKVDAATNKVYFDGVEQEGEGFKVTKVTNKTSFDFDPSKIYLRSDINLSGTDVSNYAERDWTKRLSYSDPNVAVEFVSNSAMRLTINPKKVKLVVEDFEITFDGARDVFDYEDQLKAHYEGLPEGEEGPDYRVFLAKFVEEELPEGVAEQRYINADILSDTGNYKIEVVQGIFTLNKKAVIVKVKGGKKIIPAQKDKDSDKYLEQKEFVGYELSCADELYDVERFVKELNKDKEWVKGAEPNQYPMGLKDTDFENGDNRFDVTFEVEDGYLEIVDDNTRYNLGAIKLNGGTFEYNDKQHPATLKDDEITVDKKTFKIELCDVKYKIMECVNPNASDKEAPVYVGEYHAYAGNIKAYIGDVDVTAFCKWTYDQEPAVITITPCLIKVKITGDKVKMVYSGKPVEWRSSATIEILDPRSEDPDETGYPTTLDTHGITLDGSTAWPVVVGEAAGETYDMGLVKAQAHNHFINNNPNYNVTQFIVEEGYMELVGEKAMFEIADPTPVDDPMYTYDGKPHPVVRDFKENNKGTFELKGDDGNTYSVQMSYPRFMFKGEEVVNAGEYTWYRTLRIKKVIDSEGLDVTALVTNNWKVGSKEFQGIVTVKSIEAEVKVKDGLSKTYGDPDSDTSTWVDITAPAGMSARAILSELDIYRVPGENVGRYEIRVDHFLQAVADEPAPGEAAKEEDIPAAAKKAAKAAKASKEYEAAEAAESESAEIAFKEEKALTRAPRDNFEISIDDKDKFYTINKAKLTITANDNEKDYGKKDPTLTAAVSKGLVGSETLPENFYSIYRDKGENVKMRPDYYTIHVKAPNKDVDWDAETHYFKDAEAAEPIPFDPPPGEAVAKEYVAKEDAVEQYAKVADRYEYAAKSMKAAKALAEKKVETEATEAKEKIDFIEAIAVSTEVSKEYPEEVAEAIPETAEAVSEDVKPEKPYISKPTEFNLLNYEVVTKNGKFNINGKNGGGDDADDNDGDNPTPAPAGGNDNNDGNGIVTADNTPTTVVENPAPTTTLTDNAAPTSGNAFWALINLICMLLTALLSLIMLIRYFGKRREEDEETGEEREIKRKGLVRLASLIPAIGAIIAFILTEDMSLPMILVDKWTLMMVVILAIQVGVAILAKVKKEDAEEEAA